MTELTILPNYEKKRLKLFGTVAAGERVSVTVEGGGEWVSLDGETQTLRLRVLFGPHLVGVFPYYTEAHEVDGSTVAADAWDTTDSENPTCELNLNTIQAERLLKLGGECLWILDDPTNDILYGTGELHVLAWPKRRGADVPYDLSGYPDFVKYAEDAIEQAASDAQDAATAATAAQEAAERLERDVAGHAQTASTAATTATNAATNAQNAQSAAGTAQAAAEGAASDAEAWAVGERGGVAVGSGDDTYNNNSKYYSGLAAAAKTAAETAQGKAEDAQEAAETAQAGAESAAQEAAEEAVATEQARAEAAEQAIEDKVDTLIGSDENKSARTIAAEEASSAVAQIVADAPAGYDTLKEIADWIAADPTRAAALSNRITALESGKVDKVAGKGLSKNDFTDELLAKLNGIAAGANNYALPPATASTLGGVKQGTGCEIAADGTLNVTGGGGDGETPIAPSTDPASQGKPADAYFTGTALAGKLSTSGGTMTGPLDIVNNTSDGTHGLRIVEGSEFGRRYDAEYGSEGVSLYDQGTKIAYINFPRNGVTREDQFALASQITGKADKSEMSVTPGTGEDADKTTIQLKSGTAATVLTQHQDISGKADSSALRYDLVTAQIIQSFSADSLPVAFTYNEVPYSISTIVSESDATHAGDLFIAVEDDGQGSITGYSLVVVLVPATGSESALLLEVAYFNADGTYNSGLDATFGGEEPVANTSPVVISVCALADRANNAVTLAVDSGDVTLVLPPAVPGKVRDLLVRVELPPGYLAANNEFSFVGASGETIEFESRDGVMPYPEEDGTYWFSLTESKPPTTESNATTYKFAVSMEPVVAVTQGGS